MNNLDQELKQFISSYRRENHDQAKQQADILFKKYSSEIKLFKTVGMLFLQNNKLEDAITVFRKIIILNPSDVNTLINIGIAYYELNQLDEALEYLKKAESLHGESSEVYYSLGLVYEKKNDTTKALTYYKKAVSYNTTHTEALINLGNIYLQQNEFYNAKDTYEKALNTRSKDPNIYHNLGVAWTKLDNFDKAIESYLNANKLHSKNSLTYYNLGFLYSKKFKYKAAILNLQKAIKLNPTVAKYYYNLAWTQSKLDKYEIAIKNYEKAIELNSNVAEYYYNLAWTQTKLYDYDRAIKNYKKAINIRPNYPQAQFKQSLILLVRENFLEGWKNYEGRVKIEEADINQKKILNLKQWNGKKFDGTLYVYGEQGVGDQILHSSMISDLYKIHPNICLIVDSRFISLFERSFKMIKIVGEEKNIKYNVNDYHILFGSLGKFLRKSINNFKAEPKPYIIPDRLRIDKYKKLFSQNNKIKVGLSWCSKGTKNQDRVINLEQLSKILTLENYEFINLQYGDTSIERELFKKKYGKEVITINNLDLMNDFEGIAAVISCCDLILTIDNWIAHLSSSIGKNTLIFLPKYPFWYWLTNRSNSLWYLNVKLFRQSTNSEWDNVIDKVYNEISKYNLNNLTRF